MTTRPTKPKPINMQSLQAELMAEVDRINRDYDDVVTDEDIRYLHDHARANFGNPEFVSSSAEGWPLINREKAER